MIDDESKVVGKRIMIITMPLLGYRTLLMNAMMMMVMVVIEMMMMVMAEEQKDMIINDSD